MHSRIRKCKVICIPERWSSFGPSGYWNGQGSRYNTRRAWMSCHEDCQCRPGVVALVFVPGIMGTRLKSRRSGSSVWDPAAGMEYEGPSGAAIEIKEQREQEMAEAQTDEEDGAWEAIGKWFQRRWIGVKERGDSVAERGRAARRYAGVIPRVSDFTPIQRRWNHLPMASQAPSSSSVWASAISCSRCSLISMAAPLGPSYSIPAAGSQTELPLLRFFNLVPIIPGTNTRATTPARHWQS